MDNSLLAARDINHIYIVVVKELTQFVYIELDRLSKIDSKTANEELNKHMKKMFKNMKKSLEEEIGSINKEFLKSDK